MSDELVSCIYCKLPLSVPSLKLLGIDLPAQNGRTSLASIWQGGSIR